MKNNNDKIDFYKKLFFGTDTPIEAEPIKTTRYKLAWNNIELIQDKLKDNEYIGELIKQFEIADDERAFSSFVKGIEIGKLL